MKDRDIITDGAIGIRAGRIVLVGSRSETAGIRAERKINAKRKVALPGLINCHTHVPMTLFRGLAEDQPLDTWLKETIWPLEAKLKRSDVYAGALLGCLEMIESGTTCFGDMYFKEHMVAEAVKKSGLRAVLAEGIIEAGDKELGERMLNDSIDFAKRFCGFAHGRITTMLGPHSEYSCSQELLRKIAEKALELSVGVHLHLAESKKMFRKFQSEHDPSETRFLDRIRLLKSHVLVAHCIDLSNNDMGILAKHNVNVAYVPVANMKLGLEAAKVKDLINLGVNVGLGTDGPASNNTLDMFETMKVGALLQKLAYKDPRVLSAYEILEEATLNGAKALGVDESVGSLEVGKRADLILVNLRKPHLTPRHNIIAAIVYSAHGSDVDTVIVDGEILMENRQVKTLDQNNVIDEAEEAASNLLLR